MTGALQVIEGRLLTPEGFVRGALVLRDGRIADIQATGAPTPRPEGEGPIVLPGFVDLHVHGGGGFDTMQGGDAVARVAQAHARHGTTSLLATTMTAPAGELRAALAAMAGACRARGPGQARVLGVHLEGPYLNPRRLGAQPDCTAVATLDEVLALHALAPVRLLTLAPEVSGQSSLVAQLSARGFKVQVGHSDGTYEDAVAALAQGAAGFTHLFNAMTGLHHRAPGVAGAALAHAAHAEIIPDLLHVHPGAIRVALRAIPGLYCVTDSTAAAGMPDGEYRLGRLTVSRCMGGVRLADGTLAGSALTMDQALRNLVGLGLPLAEASRRTSTIAADYLGEPLRGRIAVGAFADLVALDDALALRGVWVEGECIEPAAG